MVAKAYHINSNLYHYAGNNPVKYTDPDGKAINFAAGAVGFVGGAVVGAIINYGTQVANNLKKGNGWESLSNVNGKEILSAAAGSGTAAMVLAMTANPVAAGAAGGAVGNLVGQGLNSNLSNFDGLSFLFDTGIGALCGAVIPGFNIKGVTTGKGSMLSVARQMITKLKNGTIKNISSKTVLKCALGTSVYGALARGDLVGNIASDIYEENSEDIENALNAFVDFIGKEMGWEE